MRNMVYQNYNTPGDYGYQGVAKRESGMNSLDGYAAKAKESKKQERLAKKQVKNAEKAARAEARRQKSVREMQARAILDKEGLTDIRVKSANVACTDPSCGPQPAIRPKTYNENVAIANRNIRQQERANQRARAQAPARAPVRSRNVAPAGYGYYRDGNRQMPVPVTPKGYVPKGYLMAVQNGRTPQSIARDAQGASARVYPSRLTPKQAGPWIKNPGYADIPGIDAPRGTKPTVHFKSRNIAPARAPVSIQPPVPYQGRAQAPVRSRNVAPDRPAYMDPKMLYPVSKSVTPVRMADPQGRPFVIPQNASGTVPKTYLHNINDARPASARARDQAINSRYVLPAAPTPYQARPWVVNPGKYDIPGIDADADTPTTYRPPRSPEAAEKKRKMNGKKVAASNARDEKGKFVAADKAKNNGSNSKGKGGNKPKAPANKKQDTAKKKGQGPTVQSKNAKSGSKKGTPSKRSCGTKTAQSKKR